MAFTFSIKPKWYGRSKCHGRMNDWPNEWTLLTNHGVLKYFSKSWDTVVQSPTHAYWKRPKPPRRHQWTKQAGWHVRKHRQKGMQWKHMVFLTVDVHVEWFFSSSSNIDYVTRVCCWIRDLCSRDMKKLSLINIKCLWAGHDWLAILIPSDSRHWKSPCFTLQFNYAIDQCRYFGGDIPSFNTRWNYKRFQSRNRSSKT